MTPGAALEFTVVQYAIIVVLGVVGGFLNVMAGGGSLLSVPALIVMGASPALSNGSNRVALIPQNISALWGFWRGGFGQWRLGLGLGLVAVPGATAGALFAVNIDGGLWKRLLAFVMLGVLVLTLRRPKKRSAVAPAPRVRLGLAYVGMAVIGVYGGFLQVGVGFLIMALLRHTITPDLVRVNAFKVMAVGIYTIPSVLVFALYGQIHWPSGLMLAAGSTVGAYGAARLQVKRGQGPIRVVFAVAVVGLAAKLLLGS